MPFFDNQSRSDLRSTYLNVWQKKKEGLPLNPLESQIAAVILDHPEYISLLEDRDRERALAREYSPDSGQSNPFLHMAMHLAVRDQAATDLPPGFRDAFNALLRRTSQLDAEHRIAEHLAEMIWQSQRSGSPPDEQLYLRRVRKLTR